MSKNSSPLSKHMGGEPDELAVQRMWDGISSRLDKPARKRWIWVAAPAFVMAAAAALFFVSRTKAAAPNAQALTLVEGASIATMEHPASAEAPRLLALSDGSVVELAPDTELHTTANSDSAVTMQLARGSTTFQVAKRPGRTWTVESAGVKVVVTGTRFRVQRSEAAIVVEVEEGSVRVIDTHGRERALVASESIRVSTSLEATSRGETPAGEEPSNETAAPTLDAGVDADANYEVEKNSDPEKNLVGDPKPAAAPLWRQALADADGDRTLALLGQKAFKAQRFAALDAKELMLLADFARGARRASDAVVPLELVVAKYSKSSVGPLAAFTLGKLYLGQLGQPALAAQAFETAITLGLPRSLQEQAYARRAKAYHQAGDHAKARQAAQSYRDAYPSGKQLGESSSWPTD